MSTADLTDDLRPDIVTADENSNDVSALLAAAAGGFTGPVECALASGGEGAAVADLDNDGKRDLVTANVATTRCCSRSPIGAAARR